MDRELKQEVHEYCKDRERRKNRYVNKMKDKQKSFREDKFFSKACQNRNKPYKF